MIKFFKNKKLSREYPYAPFKQDIDKNFFLNSIFIYSKQKFKYATPQNANPLSALTFQEYQSYVKSIKNKTINLEYHLILEEIYELVTFSTLIDDDYDWSLIDFYDEPAELFSDLSPNSSPDTDEYFSAPNLRTLATLSRYLYAYNFFFIKNFSELFFFFKSKNKQITKNLYQLILTFTNKKIFINFLSVTAKKNYFFLSSGLFIKYFAKKKSLKKNKIIKILMAKYVRKIFLILKFQNTLLTIKHNPVFLREFLNTLNTPIVHSFYDPLAKQILDDSANKHPSLRFLYFLFLKNENFTFQKTRKKGRIKRKITRKLTLKNNLID